MQEPSLERTPTFDPRVEPVEEGDAKTPGAKQRCVHEACPLPPTGQQLLCRGHELAQRRQLQLCAWLIIAGSLLLTAWVASQEPLPERFSYSAPLGGAVGLTGLFLLGVCRTLPRVPDR